MDRSARTLDEVVKSAEVEAIAAALVETDGNVKKAAAALSIPERSLRHRIRALGVNIIAIRAKAREQEAKALGWKIVDTTSSETAECEAWYCACPYSPSGCK